MICAKLHWNPCTEYRVVISCIIVVNGQWTGEWPESLHCWFFDVGGKTVDSYGFLVNKHRFKWQPTNLSFRLASSSKAVFCCKLYNAVPISICLPEPKCRNSSAIKNLNAAVESDVHSSVKNYSVMYFSCHCYGYSKCVTHRLRVLIRFWLWS